MALGRDGKRSRFLPIYAVGITIGFIILAFDYARRQSLVHVPSGIRVSSDEKIQGSTAVAPISGDTHENVGSCLDALILYHKDDEFMFVKQGGFQSAKDHLVGVRKFFVLSADKSSFSDLIDERVVWIDEKLAPFNRRSFAGAKRPEGWLFQQALKLWAVRNVDDMCNDIIVVDSDIVWLRDVDVKVTVPGPCGFKPGVGNHLEACPPLTKIKYNLASMDSGAWYGDITNGEYHHFVNWFLGFPKVLRNTHTAINNFQVMQRDVMAALEYSLKDRGIGSLQEAIISYGKRFNGMSEYEAYFSFAWTHYRERIQPVYLPWILRKKEICDYNDKELVKKFVEKTKIVYWTCHDNYGADDYYINCKGRESQCDPALA